VNDSKWGTGPAGPSRGLNPPIIGGSSTEPRGQIFAWDSFRRIRAHAIETREEYGWWIHCAEPNFPIYGRTAQTEVDPLWKKRSW
jgi:hypothetical protein